MPSRSPAAVRLAAVMAVGALVTTACGARLTPAQRSAALSQGTGGGNGSTSSIATTGDSGTGSATGTGSGTR